MSYDLLFFFPKEGETLIETAQDHEPGEAIPLTPDRRMIIDKIIEKLEKITPGLQLFEYEDHVEVFSADELGLGISVNFYMDEGGLSIPYWEFEDTDKVLTVVSSYLRVVSEVGGYAIYDSQIEEIIGPENGYRLSESSFNRGVQLLAGLDQRPPERSLVRKSLRWLMLLLLASLVFVFSFQNRNPAHLPEHLEDSYILTADINQRVTRSTRNTDYDSLVWVVKRGDKVLMERGARNEVSYRYYRLVSGQTYTVHLEAIVNWRKQVVSNTVTLTP